MKKAYVVVAVYIIFSAVRFGAHGQVETGLLPREAEHNVTDEVNIRHLRFLERLKELGVPRGYDETDAEYIKLLDEVKELSDPSRVREPSPFALIKAGDIDGLTAYLDKGGDPNLDLGLSNTPYPLLASAVVGVRVDCAELLLDRGADVNAEVGEGSTPLSLTEEMLQLAKTKSDAGMVVRLENMIALLKSHGAKEKGSEK
jgi:hypothetical protein